MSNAVSIAVKLSQRFAWCHYRRPRHISYTYVYISAVPLFKTQVPGRRCCAFGVVRIFRIFQLNSINFLFILTVVIQVNDYGSTKSSAIPSICHIKSSTPVACRRKPEPSLPWHPIKSAYLRKIRSNMQHGACQQEFVFHFTPVISDRCVVLFHILATVSTYRPDDEGTKYL
jgi:hypothetical protein